MADMLTFYNECRARGLNVRGLSGWSSWQSGYYFFRNGWSTGNSSSPPQCFINHHTATSAYTSNVKNSKGQSKANIWLGLDRGNTGTGRMYSTGSGVARADFAVRYAANYGNGACNKAVYDNYVLRNRVAPNRPSGGDNGYANRMGIGMEIIHPGTGGPLDPGVWELAAQLNAVATDVFGWPSNLARMLDHRSSTTRKQDLNFAQKQNGYTINALRTRTAQILGGTVPPPIDPPEPEELEVFLPMIEGDGMGDRTAKKSDWSLVQRYLNEHTSVTPKLTTDGKYGTQSVRAVRQVVSDNLTQNGRQVGGQAYYIIERGL